MKIDGERMKALRHERMLTQEEVAKLAGLTQDTVIAAERGRSVSPKTARKITEALGAEPKDLLPGKVEAPQQSGRSGAGSLSSLDSWNLAKPHVQKAALADIASSYELLEELEAEMEEVIEAERRRRQDRSA